MKRREYLENVRITESKKCYIEDVDPKVLKSSIFLSRKMLESLDILKRFLFYGKNEEYVKKYVEHIEAVVEFSEKEAKLDANSIDPRLLHGIVGLATEVAEVLEVLEKTLFHGEELDRHNLFEERGDIEYYLALIDDSLNFEEEAIRSQNIKKLKARYPQGFETEKAMNRNVAKEQKIISEYIVLQNSQPHPEPNDGSVKKSL